MKTGIFVPVTNMCKCGQPDRTQPVLDGQPLRTENDTVIAPAEPRFTEVATHTILIVDDDRSVADTFARMLKLEGFEVATALSADDGLELANRVRPDAIILDMRMPVVSGLDFLRQLRRDPRLRETPVAIVTGDYFLNEPILAEMRALGATVRYKPLWMDDLTALAQSLLARENA